MKTTVLSRLFILLLSWKDGKRHHNFVEGFFAVPSAVPSVCSSPPSSTRQQRILSFGEPANSPRYKKNTARRVATVVDTSQDAAEEGISSSSSSILTQTILNSIASSVEDAKQYAEMFGLSSSDAAFYSVFSAIRKAEVPLGLKGEPFLLRRADIVRALGLEPTDSPFGGFFTLEDLAKATQEDFLDATRGLSGKNNKGWQITAVSEPRGNSFEDARMTFDDVQDALDKGTVILNAAGSHIPKLAGPSLGCTDATCLPNAINLYVTAAGKRTSAPPHTDRQDVVVIQTSGRKHWRVYSPPNPALTPLEDMFARGKMEDNLPRHRLEEESELLMETILEEGDVLFVPAAFPHTTSTANMDGFPDDVISVHLTFNIDTHVWDLDYLNARRYALRRAGCPDPVLGQTGDDDNIYVGALNQLPENVRKELLTPFPLGLLEDDEHAKMLLIDVKSELKRISHLVDRDTAASVDPSVWDETVEQMREQGKELLEIHRDMYVAAIEEGRTREAEEAMTAHLGKKRENTSQTMTPERMQRLSVFRVKPFYEKITESKQKLVDWSHAGKTSSLGSVASSNKKTSLPENWAFTMPVKIGDTVEADLGGAFFEATVTRIVADSKYDVQFFDGDIETGLERSMVRLLKPPAVESEEISSVDTSKMTAKQLKRWKKQQKKKQNK